MLPERTEQELERIDIMCAQMLRQSAFDGVPATHIWDLAAFKYDNPEAVVTAKGAAEKIERDDDFQKIHVIDVRFVEEDAYRKCPCWHVVASVFWRDPPGGGRYLYTVEAETGRNIGGRML